MILADWNVFACKFSGNEQAAFEQFCYLLFCKKKWIRDGYISFLQ